MATKHEVIKDALDEYLKASKEEKGVILDRLENIVKMHRKAIVRRLRVLQTRKEGYDWSDTRGRSVYYTSDVTEALRYLWDFELRNSLFPSFSYTIEQAPVKVPEL